ncbi:uncharacterized protein LOC132867932 [Neoarius graeffei]|uniref:uncharacterized protein LOC132867932 n=1 Tax=Neoarius graeffei TaxID=443677 RepID=UPI00298CFDDD|nr:uncharacterized protein LOC132867932 [Neoarius graeffei]
MTWMIENLHRHVSTHFGMRTLRLVREYEKCSRKLADYRNHLRFNLRCRQSNIIPTSLRLFSTVKGHRAEIILQKAQKRLLKERVRQVHFTIDALQNKTKLRFEELTALLPSEVLERVSDLTEKAQLSQHTKGKERQMHKFQKLLSKTTSSGKTEGLTWRRKSDQATQPDIEEKWVKNLSDRVLTQPERDVLSKGLNFAVSPEQIPVVELITATETAIRNNNLTNTESEQLRLKISAALSSAKAPPSNLTSQERRALTVLQRDRNITILPADKGRCTVVLNTADYHSRMTSLLSDTTTYETLRRDPTSGYKRKVVSCLQQLEKDQAINQSLYYRLYPGEAVPLIYGLPKIHKEGAPLRPIISSINSVTYNIPKHLATILTPLVGNTPYVKNSQDFASKVADLKLDSDETMVSYDVNSLFTCIPTTEAVESVRKRLIQDSSLLDRTKLTTDQICTLLDLCLTTIYFQFNESFYRQKHGCAMGSPVSPIVANLYMEEVEHIALTTFAGVAPSHWFRYVDDTWVKIKIQEVEAFSKHINAVDSNINFTREEVSGNNLAFLDCDVHIRQDRSLSIEVYRKPPHTDQYLLFDSHHPLEHKLGVIRTLQHRAQNIPTTLEGKEKEQNHIKKALQNCGYPNWAFLKSIKRNITDKDDNRNKRKNIVIPYISGLSEKLRRIFYKHNIPVHFRPNNTLKQKLVHPKNRIPRHKQDNVVYAIQCSENCTDLYIGETKQPLYRRLAQHRRASSSGQDSAVYIHLNNKGHSFQDCNVRILAREDRWYERGVKEAIFVNLERPSLNRGGGLRHHLSNIYKAVLDTLPRRLGVRQDPAVFGDSQEDRESQIAIDHPNGQSFDHPNDSPFTPSLQ